LEIALVEVPGTDLERKGLWKRGRGRMRLGAKEDRKER
jgi:hypothetical protein